MRGLLFFISKFNYTMNMSWIPIFIFIYMFSSQTTTERDFGDSNLVIVMVTGKFYGLLVAHFEVIIYGSDY